MLNIKKKVAMALATTAMGAMLIGAGTFAIFTSNATNQANSFKAGKVSIEANESAFVNNNIQNLAPGDHDSKTITVSNDGTLELRYDIDEQFSGGLTQADTTPSNSPDYQEGSTPLEVTIKDATGAVITPGNNNNRVLGAGESEILTVEYKLPKEAGNFYKEKTADLTFAFKAEQTKNN